MIKCFKLRIV